MYIYRQETGYKHLNLNELDEGDKQAIALTKMWNAGYGDEEIKQQGFNIGDIDATNTLRIHRKDDEPYECLFDFELMHDCTCFLVYVPKDDYVPFLLNEVPKFLNLIRGMHKDECYAIELEEDYRMGI